MDKKIQLVLLPGQLPTPLNYAAKANSSDAKLSFAFIDFVTLTEFPPGNSTFSLTPVDPKFGPIISTLAVKCVYGGAAGYRPRVQFVVDWLQHCKYIYTLRGLFCQPVFNKFL